MFWGWQLGRDAWATNSSSWVYFCYLAISWHPCGVRKLRERRQKHLPSNIILMFLIIELIFCLCCMLPSCCSLEVLKNTGCINIKAYYLTRRNRKGKKTAKATQGSKVPLSYTLFEIVSGFYFYLRHNFPWMGLQKCWDTFGRFLFCSWSYCSSLWECPENRNISWGFSELSSEFWRAKWNSSIEQ